MHSQIHMSALCVLLRILFSITFLPLTSGRVYFFETFHAGWERRWTKSQWKASEGTQGDWKWAHGFWFGDEREDKGIETDGDNRYWGISAHFQSFSNEGKDLIIQYQVNNQRHVQCGGSYVKIGPKMENATQFGGDTPYHIKFGPDICGTDHRTHLVFHHNGKYVGKTKDLDYKQPDEKFSQLYRMILTPNSRVRVEIGDNEIYEGSLTKDWDFSQSKTIADPGDKKPADWVEDAMMDDPESKKPDDWVDVARIKDHTAYPPDSWNEEEDGEWEVPMIDNPDFKGEWTPRQIHNPAWDGFWNPRRINNPEYEGTDNLHKFADISYFGIDIWQVRGHTIFDNIIICDNIAEADHIKEKWKALRVVEHRENTKPMHGMHGAFGMGHLPEAALGGR